MRHIGSISVVLMFALCGTVFAGSEFLTYASYPVSHALTFASGDFASNGRSDLAVINLGGSVIVFLANSDGSFQAPAKYHIGANPRSIAAGDVNGDGKLDIIVADNGDPKIFEFGSIGILFGNGDGTFRKAVHVSVGPVYPTWLGVADLNSDGKLDVVLQSSGALTVYLGEGNGKFKTGATYLPLTLIRLADFNNDGKPDLVELEGGYCGKQCHVEVFIGNGDGTFQSGVSTALPKEPIADAQMLTGDFNNDGDQDLVLGSGKSSGFFVLLGNGDGTFSVSSSAPVGPIAGAAGDFNQDGRLDLLVHFGSGLAISIGNGDGTFQEPTLGYDLGSTVFAGIYGSGGKFGVVSLNTNDIGVGLGNGDGSLRAARIETVAFGASPVIAASFNNDRNADIAWLHNADQNYSYVGAALGDGTGLFTLSGSCSFNGQIGLTLRAADLNHDNNLDLIAGTKPEGDLWVCLGNGDGTFQPPLGIFAGGGSNELDIADFNDDGNLDLVVPTGGLVNILLGNGDGTFQSPYNQAIGTHANYVVAVDVNGDGKLDLVIEGDRTYVLLGKGNGKFGKAGAISTMVGSSVRTGDFNHDGVQDLAIMYGGSVTVMLGKGGGRFQTGVSYGSGFTGQWTLKDFDQDGNLDILAITSSGFSMLSGNKDGTFQSPVSYLVTGVSYVAAKDFNNDGKLDLIFSAESGGIVVLNTTGK